MTVKTVSKNHDIIFEVQAFKFLDMVIKIEDFEHIIEFPQSAIT